MGEFWKCIHLDMIPQNSQIHKNQLSKTCGLVNLGATCYFNSLIQQFANMKWFVDMLFEHCSKDENLEFIPKIDNGKLYYDVLIF
jgi:uncharacterized UBP type Zn finger protein